MVALAIGRCQFRIQGSAVTELSPVDITPSRYSRDHYDAGQWSPQAFGPFALHTTRCTAGRESNIRRRNMIPVEAAFNESRIATTKPKRPAGDLCQIWKSKAIHTPPLVNVSKVQLTRYNWQVERSVVLSQRVSFGRGNDTLCTQNAIYRSHVFR
jgi:hypothetical protein